MFFLFGEYANISEPVSKAQTNNLTKASAVRAALQVVCSDRDMRLCSDSKWCVDALKNIEQYKRSRKWFTKGKQPIRHHDL